MKPKGLRQPNYLDLQSLPAHRRPHPPRVAHLAAALTVISFRTGMTLDVVTPLLSERLTIFPNSAFSRVAHLVLWLVTLFPLSSAGPFSRRRSRRRVSCCRGRHWIYRGFRSGGGMCAADYGGGNCAGEGSVGVDVYRVSDAGGC